MFVCRELDIVLVASKLQPEATSITNAAEQDKDGGQAYTDSDDNLGGAIQLTGISFRDNG